MDIIENTKKFIRSFFENEFSGHDHFHSFRVYELACKIAAKEHADISIVSLAALLHDVDDIKLSPQTYENKENAHRFLKEQGLCESDISRIIKIIDEVSFQGTDSVKPSTLEGQCVQDADRLDALGAIGIARAFAFGGNHNRVMYDPEIPPVIGMNKEEYRNHVSTTVNHFYEKLFLLKDMINTKSAYAIACQREAYMKDFIDEFMKEWDGKD